MRLFATFFALLALAVPAFAQQRQQPFGEEIEVNAVLLDVTVTDARGNQILGLTPEDFVVKENGVAQTIDSVDYFTNRQLLNEREENAPFKVERVHEDRYFIFFFDKPSDPGALSSQLALAREAARDFVRNQMKPTDFVAIAGHDMRLKIYSDFSNDRTQLERAIDDAARYGRGLTKASGSGDAPSIVRTINSKQMVNKTGTVYQALDLLADSVRGIRGRKNVILFSPGIADRDEAISNEMLLSRSRYLDPMLASLNAANVSVHAAQLQLEVATSPIFHQRLTEIAESTGGRYFQYNTTFQNAVKSVEEANAGYYLITYRSRHGRGERGFQKVEVSVRNPEFRVTSRAGYQYGG
ncbi:MAG: VWA domain-containing protein [Acidobacteriota bacterium]|nr:VWA domain-containing protein [Acidobacteriota bacterium]